MNKMLLSVLVVFVAIFTGCSSSTTSVQTDQQPRYLGDAELEQVAPGVLYMKENSHIHIRLYPSMMDGSSVELLKEEIEALQSPDAAISPLGISPNASSVVDRQDLVSAFEDAIRAKLAMGAGDADVTAQGRGLFCSAYASAMPTTSSPGAKAYSNADCWYRLFSAKARAFARAGSEVDRPSADEGIAHAHNFAIAHGSSGCFSSASAAGYIHWGSVTYLNAYDYDSNSSCR